MRPLERKNVYLLIYLLCFGFLFDKAFDHTESDLTREPNHGDPIIQREIICAFWDGILGVIDEALSEHGFGGGREDRSMR